MLVSVLNTPRACSLAEGHGTLATCPSSLNMLIGADGGNSTQGAFLDTWDLEHVMSRFQSIMCSSLSYYPILAPLLLFFPRPSYLSTFPGRLCEIYQFPTSCLCVLGTYSANASAWINVCSTSVLVCFHDSLAGINCSSGEAVTQGGRTNSDWGVRVVALDKS